MREPHPPVGAPGRIPEAAGPAPDHVLEHLRTAIDEIDVVRQDSRADVQLQLDTVTGRLCETASGFRSDAAGDVGELERRLERAGDELLVELELHIIRAEQPEDALTSITHAMQVLTRFTHTIREHRSPHSAR